MLNNECLKRVAREAWLCAAHSLIWAGLVAPWQRVRCEETRKVAVPGLSLHIVTSEKKTTEN